MPTAASVDEYIARFPEETRGVLEEVRAVIKETAPMASEKISYGIPTFELHGRYLIYFAGYTKHVSVYPVTRGMVEVLGDEIARYRSGKGTLQFPLGRPMPFDLIRRIVEIRVAESDREAAG